MLVLQSPLLEIWQIGVCSLTSSIELEIGHDHVECWDRHEGRSGLRLLIVFVCVLSLFWTQGQIQFLLSEDVTFTLTAHANRVKWSHDNIPRRTGISPEFISQPKSIRWPSNHHNGVPGIFWNEHGASFLELQQWLGFTNASSPGRNKQVDMLAHINDRHKVLG